MGMGRRTELFDGYGADGGGGGAVLDGGISWMLHSSDVADSSTYLLLNMVRGTAYKESRLKPQTQRS